MSIQLIAPVLFVLLILVNSSVQVGTFDPDVMCLQIKNGTKIKDPRACNTWIQCINREPITGACPENEFYNRNTEKCVPFQSIECVSSNPCAPTAGTDGFVADPYSCNVFYYCIDGLGSQGQCDPGYNFDVEAKNCIRNFPCITKMNPDNLCNIVPDDIFVKDLNNSKSFEVCQLGSVITDSCPDAFYLDAFIGICVRNNQATTTALPIQPDPEDVCENLVSDNYSCNGYYYCQKTTNGGITIEHGVCPKGRFFDGSTDGGACVDRTQVVCSHNRCAGFGSPSIELANEPNDNCVGYAICQNGVKIGSGTCPTGEYFNEMAQNCATTVISLPACASSRPIAVATVANNDE